MASHGDFHIFSKYGMNIGWNQHICFDSCCLENITRKNIHGNARTLPQMYDLLMLQYGQVTMCYNNTWYWIQHSYDKYRPQINGLVQERRNSSVLAMVLHLSCTKPSRWSFEPTKDNLYFVLRGEIWCLPHNQTFVRGIHQWLLVSGEFQS